MDYTATAKQILDHLGGEKNVASVTHCMTRLRLYLKDDSIPKDEEVKAIGGVLGVVRGGQQYQVIIGNNVAKCYQEVTKPGNFAGSSSAADQPKEKQNPVNVALDFIAGCMTSLISAIIAGGLLKVLQFFWGHPFSVYWKQPVILTLLLMPLETRHSIFSRFLLPTRLPKN